MTTAVAYGSTFADSHDAFCATHRSFETLATDRRILLNWTKPLLPEHRGGNG